MNISLITDEYSHDPFTAIELGSRWGIDHFEIRYAYRWRLPLCPRWACDLTAAAVEKYGVTVTAISPGLFKPVMLVDGARVPISIQTPDEIRRHIEELLPQCFAFAERLNTRNITVFALPRPSGDADGAAAPAVVIDALAAAAGKAAAAGFVLLLENGQGSWADSGAASRSILETVGSPALRLTWDPANVVHGGCGEEPVAEGYPLIRDYVVNVHMKDAVWLDGQGRWVMLGEGVVDWKSQIRQLKEAGYTGYVTAESHLQYESPMHLVEKMETFLARMRDLIG